MTHRDPSSGGDDPQGMLAIVEASPHDWAGAPRPTMQVAPRPVRAAVVVGMGGSGIASDVAAVAARSWGNVPVIGCKGADLPAFVDRDCLVVAVSYSGNTEETLRCVEQARAAGAPLVGVTSGGELARQADDDGFPVVLVPGGRQPRAALPHLVVPVLLLLEHADVLAGIIERLAAVPDHLAPLAASWGRDSPTDRNPAKATALRLERLVPLFYGARGWPAVAALRGKCQVNENAKRPAFWNELPELDHNEIAGWQRLGDVARWVGMVALRSPADEEAGVDRRFVVTREVMADPIGTVLDHTVEGPNALARLAALILFVDLVSVYLAYLDGVDPTPVDVLNHVKEQVGRPAARPPGPGGRS